MIKAICAVLALACVLAFMAALPSIVGMVSGINTPAHKISAFQDVGRALAVMFTILVVVETANAVKLQKEKS